MSTPQDTGFATFADLLAASTAPWNDPGGFWATYNAAIATMFETVYDIVADRGDINFTEIANLSAPVDTTGVVSFLSVQNLVQDLAAGTEIVVAGPVTWQDYTTSADVVAGAATIPVETHIASPGNTVYPVGSAIQLDYVPGWSDLLDPDDCPDQFLPYLAQFNGTAIPVGLDAATARLKIRFECAQLRGTLASIQYAVRRNLTGTQSVAILERIDALGNPNAYWFIVLIRPEEVPGGNAQPIIDAVNAVKPGGVMWTLVQTDSWIISQMEASQASIGALEANFVTITGLETDQPGR